jgi:hypothetical protein
MVLKHAFSIPADEKIVALGKENYYQIEGNRCYTIADETEKLDLTYLLNKEGQQKFLENDNGLGYNQSLHATYWKKIQVVNHSNIQTWFLEFPDLHISSVQLYLVSNGKLKEYPRTGFGLPFQSRSIPNKNFVFDISLPKGASETIYAKISSERYSGITPNIRSIINYSGYFIAEYHLLGIFYGVLFILAVYNLMLGIYLFERVYFFYFTYLVSAALYTYMEDGLGFQWWWNTYPNFNIWVEYGAPILLLFSFLLYTDNFLDLDRHNGKLRKSIWASATLFSIAQLFLNEYNQLTFLLYIIPFALAYFAGIRRYNQGFGPARFYLLGGLVIFLSFIIFYLRIISWVMPNPFTVYVFNYGFVIEAIFFSVSLSDKFRHTKDEKERAQNEIIYQLKVNDELQQKVNKELEAKVKERTVALSLRTSELEKSNKELELLKEKLYAMNSSMDKNIWELNKKVKEELAERIFNKMATYEAFCEVFTEVKCYQYLAELKWKDGFVCSKCGNTKYGRGNTNFTYKCTVCQNQESVTANTLFHGIKFPVTKAFYLAYVLFKESNQTYDQLAAQLDLNRNTIWKFATKVHEKRDHLKLNNVGEKDWESLII